MKPESQFKPPAHRVGSRSRRLLVVEDSKDTRLLVQLELEWLGYHVASAASAVTGLVLARRERPDLVVSDIRMPGMDGYEFLHRLRAFPELAGIPAIALTGMGKKGEVEVALSEGFDACVVKPSGLESLPAVIQQHLD